jgi:alkylhydroperoxidase family enzyme
MARDRSEEIPKESKIPMLSAGAASAAAEEVGLPAQMAELNIFRALLHDPELAKAVSDVLLTLLFRGKLDARLRELIIMRIGWATGSVYEWTQHWRIARQLGVEEADLLALRDWRSSDRFGEPEQAILAATDETLETGTISAETWKRCEAAPRARSRHRNVAPDLVGRPKPGDPPRGGSGPMATRRGGSLKDPGR